MKRGEILRRLNTVERELRELREEVANKPQWQPCCWPAQHNPQWQPYNWPPQYSPQDEWTIWTVDVTNPPPYTMSIW